MKAVLCKQFGPPETLVVEELPSPRPGPGEVVVSVKAASVNFPDVLVIQNRYQVKATPPFTPGSEFAGVVKEVGAGVTQVKPGDRVLGAGSSGGFAEECLVPAGGRLVPIPASMDFPTAASFLLTYGTSHHALCNRADAKAGESLLVLGAAGGVGLAAVEIGDHQTGRDSPQSVLLRGALEHAAIDGLDEDDVGLVGRRVQPLPDEKAAPGGGGQQGRDRRFDFRKAHRRHLPQHRGGD
mgnify:CR=1 FL=1